MTRKNYIRNMLLAALIICALIGIFIHFMVHPSGKLQVYYVPIISGLISLFVVPVLFLFKKTIHYGYALNGFTVIIGTVTMIHFSIFNFPHPFLFSNILYKTLIIDVLILLIKFFIGKALFDLEMFSADLKSEHRGTWYRYPNMGWWGVHFASISIIYTIGHIIWRGL